MIRILKRGGETMDTLFKLGNQYVAASDWKNIAMLKLCLIPLRY